MLAQYKPLWHRIRRYYRDYGGSSAVFGSPLFAISVLLTGVSYSTWSSDGWVATSQSVLPGLLGFSLGTYAILFSLMTTRLKGALKAIKNPAGISYLDEINATFFHFIVVQTIGIAWTFLFKATLIMDIASFFASADAMSRLHGALQYSGGIIGFLLLVYSITLTIAAALAVYRIAAIVDPGE